MTPKVLEMPEEFKTHVYWELGGRYEVSLRPADEKGVEAILLVTGVAAKDKESIRAKVAMLCASFHDRTRKLIVPVIVSDTDEG